MWSHTHIHSFHPLTGSGPHFFSPQFDQAGVAHRGGKGQRGDGGPADASAGRCQRADRNTTGEPEAKRGEVGVDQKVW